MRLLFIAKQRSITRSLGWNTIGVKGGKARRVGTFPVAAAVR